MIPAAQIEDETDAELWQQVCQGSTPAFEELVRRYQSMVSAVAYNACGDLALSEDVAQETFWAAWRERATLAQPRHLRAWLCGIARNLGKNARRRASRPAEAAAAGDALADVAADLPSPADAMVSREEETLVWQALEEIPELYREPLILYYREQQPVTEVAAALGLRPDAIKQRLSRGREMLRERVAEMVEGVLQRSRPGRKLTVAVMAGLTTLSASTKTALAGTGGAASGMVGTKWLAAAGGGLTGVLGGVLGSLLGVAGGWFGTWCAEQIAPTKQEREIIRRTGWRMLLATILFTLLGLASALALTGRAPVGYSLALGIAMMAAYWIYLLFETLRMAQAMKRIHAARAPGAPNDTPLRRRWTALTAPLRGRVYRSPVTFLGLPLVDINVSDPALSGGICGTTAPAHPRRVARGWIAVGDNAYGFLAIGGFALGVFSFGGIAVGLIALGGLAAGGFAFGGLGLGGFAVGGVAVGWQSCGGMAVGWDLACGGGAVGWHAAFGGGALAHEYAVGGTADALHANDALAKTIVNDYGLVQGFQWYIEGVAWIAPCFVLLSLLGASGLIPLLYRREEDPSTHRPTAHRGFRFLWLVAALIVLVGLGLLFLRIWNRSTSPAAAPAPESKEERLQLPNGLNVILRPIQGATQTALVVLYSLGGDHDPEGRSGLAHMLEHLYVTAPAGAAKMRPAEQIMKRYPGGWNAQTGDRYTVIATVFPAKDLEQELQDAAARMGDLRVTAADLQREKPRVLDELANMFGRLPQLGAMNTARELVRPTPLGGRKGGQPEHVRAITLQEVQERWQRYYKPRNALLVIAGAVDVAAARKTVDEHFAKLPPGENAPVPREPGQARLGMTRELTVKPSVAQASAEVCLAYRAPAPASELYAPYLVLVARMQANSGNLKVGQGRFPVYCPLLDDPGMVGIAVPAKTEETAAEAVKRLKAFVAEAVQPAFDPKEVQSLSTMFGPMLGISENADAILAANPYFVAFSLGRWQQLGIDPVRLQASLAKLRDEDLRRAATEVFGPDQCGAAFINVKRK